MNRHITWNVSWRTDSFPGSWVLCVVVIFQGVYIVLVHDGFKLTDLKVVDSQLMFLCYVFFLHSDLQTWLISSDDRLTSAFVSLYDGQRSWYSHLSCVVPIQLDLTASVRQVDSDSLLNRFWLPLFFGLDDWCSRSSPGAHVPKKFVFKIICDIPVSLWTDLPRQ